MEGQVSTPQAPVSSAPPSAPATTTPASTPTATPGVPGQKATGVELGNGKAEQAATPRYFEHKVNGETRRYTVDELLAKASLGEAARERFEKASELVKKVEQYREQLKKDPFSVLANPEVGMSRDELRKRFESWYHENYIEPETLTDEQKKLKELERWKRQKEEEETSRKTQDEQRSNEVLDARTRELVQKEVVEGLEKHGLPKTRFTASRYAYWAKQNLKNGYDAPPEVIWHQVKAEDDAIFQHKIEATPIERLIELAGGDKFINAVRKYDLARLKSKFDVKDTQIQNTQKPASNERRTMADVDRYFNELRRTR